MPLHKLDRTILTRRKRTDTLRTLLNRGASEYQLLKAAGRVRDARIQVLRALIGAMPPLVLLMREHTNGIVKLEGQIEMLRSTTPMAILAEFRTAGSRISEES